MSEGKPLSLWAVLSTHLAQCVVFLFLTQIVGTRLQKIIANVPPFGKGGT